MYTADKASVIPPLTRSLFPLLLQWALTKYFTVSWAAGRVPNHRLLPLWAAEAALRPGSHTAAPVNPLESKVEVKINQSRCRQMFIEAQIESWAGVGRSELPQCLSAPGCNGSGLAPSLPTPNILPLPACHPRQTLIPSDLGSVAETSPGCSPTRSVALKLGVVFGTRRATSQSSLPRRISREHFSVSRLGPWHCLCVCVSVWGGGGVCLCVFLGGLFIGASTGSRCFLADSETSVACLAVTSPLCRRLVVRTSVCSCQPPGQKRPISLKCVHV